MDNILDVTGVSKKYGQQIVVKDLNLRIEQADIYGLLGPNGAGKSTSIKIILGLIHPDKGEVLINKFSILSQKQQALQSVGAIVEGPSFYNHMSAYKNLKLYAGLYGIEKERIDQVLEIVGLDQEKNKKVKNYSMGMKQRLGIAQAIMNRPQFVILDEPTNGLDPQGVIEIRSLIRLLAKEEKTSFLICSHILGEIEQMCNKIAIINKGEILASGEIKSLISRSGSSTLEEYYLKIVSRG